MPDNQEQLRDAALAFVMAFSDANLSARDVAWEGIKAAVQLYDLDPARTKAMVDRLRKFAAS